MLRNRDQLTGSDRPEAVVGGVEKLPLRNVLCSTLMVIQDALEIGFLIVGRVAGWPIKHLSMYR